MVFYIDANIFILSAIDIGKRGEASRDIITKITSGKEPAITASLTIDEVVWKLWKETGKRELAIEQSLRILKMPNIKVVPVYSEDIFQALLLMQKYRDIKPRDAIHASVAISHGVYSIVSDDSDFDDIKEVNRVLLIQG